MSQKVENSIKIKFLILQYYPKFRNNLNLTIYWKKLKKKSKKYNVLTKID